MDPSDEVVAADVPSQLSEAESAMRTENYSQNGFANGIQFSRVVGGCTRLSMIIFPHCMKTIHQRRI